MKDGIDTLLGFDYGTRYIGVAIGQTLTASARPLATLRQLAGRPDWVAIGRLIEQWRPQALVVGIPLCMDDSEQPLTHAARRFARQMRGRFGLPVHETDERLSSREAYAIGYAEGRRTRRVNGQRLRPIVDDLAAEVILRTYLDAVCRNVADTTTRREP